MANEQGFYGYFKANMEAMGLPAPDSLFGTLAAAQTTIKSLAEVVEKFGTRVTIMELIAAGTLSEGLMYVGGLTAALYLGACIGSLAVATGRYISGGHMIADVFFVNTVTKNDIPLSPETRHALYHLHRATARGYIPKPEYTKKR